MTQFNSKVAELLGQGFSWTEIAQKLGVNYQQVRTAVKILNGTAKRGKDRPRSPLRIY